MPPPTPAEETKLRSQLHQADLPPDQRQQLEDRLNQLRGQQNQLRARQDQLRATNPDPFANPPIETSPFTAVRFDGEKIFVSYDAVEYELADIQSMTAPELVAFCKKTYGDLWQKRIAEDLVVVLKQSGHAVNADETVALTLKNAQTGESKSVDHAGMTRENRMAILQSRMAESAK